jgi:hypothetical protein
MVYTSRSNPEVGIHTPRSKACIRLSKRKPADRNPIVFPEELIEVDDDCIEGIIILFSEITLSFGETFFTNPKVKIDPSSEPLPLRILL